MTDLFDTFDWVNEDSIVLRDQPGRRDLLKPISAGGYPAVSRPGIRRTTRLSWWT
jgi:hypothetical protein